MKRRQAVFRRKVPLIFIVFVTLLICVFLLCFGAKTVAKTLYPMKFQSEVETYAAENDLPLELVYAIVRCESGFDPDAVSSVGARGLMQLMESSFEWVRDRLAGEKERTFDDMFSPDINLKYGCRLFALLLEEYETVPNALCAYHAGWGITRKWLDDPKYAPDGKNIENIPYRDTALYVDKVMHTAEIYRKLYDL